MVAKDDDFAEFATSRWADLVRSAVFLGCSVTEAQDVAQTTLLRCYVAWRRVESATDRNGYVYRILVNCLRDWHRRAWARERATDVLPESSAEDPYATVDVSDAIHRALAGLSKPNRDVVVLRHLTGLSEEQVARALGIAVGTVKSRSSRGLAQLATNRHLSELSRGLPNER